MKPERAWRHWRGALFHFSLLATLLPALLLYQGGLSGGFHLDDTPNLQRLASDDTGLIAFLAGAPVGGSGRPFSYLSFYWQKASYPDDPGAFLRVNLGIHLLNTALLYWLVVGLARARALARPALLGAVVTIFWSILPIHISTVLYVVQRMTLLSATFVLLACAGYVHERLKARGEGWNWRRALRLGGWVVVGYLGVLAKENAILVGLALALIESFFLASSGAASPPRWWRWTAFYLPLLALLFYLLVLHPVTGGYATRDFTLSERLWTEARVLWDYLKLILLPDFNDLVLYHDDFPVSRSVSWSEIATVAGLLVGVVLAFLGRRGRYAAPAFGFLWFLALHLLESTIVPLELYFEHRNYLPSVGLVIGLGFLFQSLIACSSKQSEKRILKALIGIAFLWMGAITAFESNSWGDSRRFLADLWYKNPDSSRVVGELVGYFVDQGRVLQAYQLLEEWGRKHPHRHTPARDMQVLYLSCLDPSVPFHWDASQAEFFRTGGYENVVSLLQEILDLKVKGGCSHLSWGDFHQLLDALLDNPRYRAGRQNTLYLKKFHALAYLAEGRSREALQAVTQGVDLRRADFDFLLLAASLAYEADKGEVFRALMVLIGQRRPASIQLGKGQRDLLQRLQEALRRYHDN